MALKTDDLACPVGRKYQAADQDDLWQFLTEQAHRDGTLPKDISVKEVMDTWTLQMGFPVVTVSRDYGTGSARLAQVRAAVGRGRVECPARCSAV